MLEDEDDIDDQEEYPVGPEFEADDGTMSHLVGYAEGGNVDPTALAHAAVAALVGLHPDPDSALEAFEAHNGRGSADGLRSVVFGSGDQDDQPSDSGFIDDDSSGMDDAITVPGPRGDVGLSGGEYVLTADTVSDIGDGNSLAGKKILDNFVNSLRKMKNGRPDQPPANGRDAVDGLIKQAGIGE